MRFAFIERHAGAYPVRLMRRVLAVSPGGCCAWRSRPESPRAAANRQLVGEIRRIEMRRHGGPRMHAALRAQGRRCGRGRVERRMRHHRIRALAGRRCRPCTTDSRHHLAVAPNLPAQRFEAPAPNRVRLADITHIATGEGWLHLAAVLDLATRKIVGWAMRAQTRTELALSALMMAVQRQRPGRGLIHHSDRGSQFAAEAYAERLALIGATASMGRTGNCCDNGPMESFFHTLKVELVHQHRWATRDHADVTCSPTSKANTIALASTPPSDTSPPNRPSRWRANPPSTETGEDQDLADRTRGLD